MARNSNAGKSTGTSKSAKHYASNPSSKAKKAAYDKKYHSSEERKKYRSELNSANKKAGTYGKMTAMGKDRSHTKGGKLVSENRSTNRARNGSGNNKRLK